MTGLIIVMCLLVVAIATIVSYSVGYNHREKHATGSYMQGWRDGLGHPRPQQMLRSGTRYKCIAEKVFYESGVKGPVRMLSLLEEESGTIIYVAQEHSLPDTKLVAVEGGDGKIRLVSQNATGEVINAVA